MDDYLIDKFDRVALWAQRHGYLLTEIKVHVCGFGVASTVAYAWFRGSYFLAGFAMIVWGGLFVAALMDAKRYRDYPSSVRMIERLNAKALEERENPFSRLCRLGIVWCMVLGMPADVLAVIEGEITKAILGIMASIGPLLVIFSATWFYIGPGEFNKKKQEVTNGQEIFDRGT